MRCNSDSGFCVGMRLVAVGILQALMPGADRQHPVAAHLYSLIQSLQSLIIECRAGVFTARGPDQGLMRVGEALAAEVWHRVRLAPDHVVQHPEPSVLNRCADAENVVIAADHPDCAIRFQNSFGFVQPGLRKGVIRRKARKAIPFIVDSVHSAVVGAVKIALQLKVIRWIGKDQVDRRIGQAPHRLDAIAVQNLIERKRRCFLRLWCCHRCLCPCAVCQRLWIKMSHQRFAVKFFL